MSLEDQKAILSDPALLEQRSLTLVRQEHVPTYTAATNSRMTIDFNTSHGADDPPKSNTIIIVVYLIISLLFLPMIDALLAMRDLRSLTKSPV